MVIPLVHEYIKVAKLPERQVAVGRRGQEGPLEWNGRDPVFLEQAQKREELPQQEQAALRGGERVEILEAVGGG